MLIMYCHLYIFVACYIYYGKLIIYELAETRSLERRPHITLSGQIRDREAISIFSCLSSINPAYQINTWRVESQDEFPNTINA